jgi:hypothetical protein
MSTSVKVARYLTGSPAAVAMPWMILALDFVINILIFAGIPSHPGKQHYAGALAAIYVMVLILGAVMTYRPRSRWE